MNIMSEIYVTNAFIPSSLLSDWSLGLDDQIWIYNQILLSIWTDFYSQTVFKLTWLKLRALIQIHKIIIQHMPHSLRQLYNGD